MVEERYRAGQWGTGMVVTNLLGAVLLAAVGILAWASVPGPHTAPGSSAAWDVVAGTLAAVIALVCAWQVVQGASALRPVRWTAGADGAAVLSVPVFAYWRGPRRVVVPVADVAAVELAPLAEGRQSRWRLVVVRADGTSVASDSVTSSRRGDADVTSTAGGRTAAALDRRVRALQQRAGAA